MVALQLFLFVLILSTYFAAVQVVERFGVPKEFSFVGITSIGALTITTAIRETSSR